MLFNHNRSTCLSEFNRKAYSDVKDVIHVLNVHRHKRLAASVLAVSLIDCVASSTPATAAETATTQSTDGNVTIDVPTKIACVVKADGTVVSPSDWAMSNKSSGKVELTGCTEVSSYSDFHLSGKSGVLNAAVGSGTGSYSISYTGTGNGTFSCTSSKPLGIAAGASLPWTFTVDKLKAGSSILSGVTSGPVHACEVTFSYSAIGEKLTSYASVSVSGLVDDYLPVGGAITANASNVPSNASVAYQWYVINSDGSYTAISNGTSKTLNASSSYSGKKIACRISDTSGHYDGYVETSKVDVKQIVPTVSISGNAVYGGTLTANMSNLPTGVTYTKSYQWQRFNGTSWENISNATASTYKFGADDVSRQVRVLVKTKAGTYVIADATSAAVSVSKASTSISTTVSGTKKIEQKLTASVSGLPAAGTNTISYKWQTSADGKTWTDSAQSDAKSNIFTPSYTLINQYVRCVAGVTNNLYNISGGTSAAFGTLGKTNKTITASLSSPNKRNGDTITCNVSGLGAGTNNLSYKWECSSDSSFKTVSSLGDTGKTHGTATGAGWYYRCTVSVSGNQYYDYNTPVTPIYGPLSKGVATAPTIAISGSNAWGSTLTAAVTNLPKYGTSKVTYQWEARNDADTAWTNSGYATATTNHIKVDATDAVSTSRHYRCKVTVDNDQYTVPVAYSTDHGKTVKASATITANLSGKAVVGEKLTCSVAGLPTTGVNTISYQWQYTSNGKTWYDSTNSGATSNSMLCQADGTLSKQYRCVVKVTNPYYSMSDATTHASAAVGKGTHTAPTVSISGNKTYGAVLTANVSGQPAGTTATSYQWQRASSVSGAWTNISNATGKTYTAGTADMNQYLRVLVNTTNTYYNVSQGVSSAYGTIGKATASISASVNGNKVIESAITANVAGLPSVGTNTVSYQWQYSSDNKAWTNSSQSDAKTKTITPNYTWAGIYVRCVISVSGNAYYNINGYTLNVGQIGKGTKTASVTLTGNAVIGGSLKANVSGLPSNGTNTIAYQWQYSSDNKTWTNSTYTDAKTATHSLAYTDAYNLYWRCTVSVSGNAYYNVNGASSASQQCGKGTATITASVSGNTVIGGKLTCAISGLPSTGTNSIAYQWQYSTDGKTWANSNNATAKSNSINLPADSTLGKHFRCIVTVTNAVYNGMSATSSATAAIGKGNHAAPTVGISGSKTYGSILTASVSGQPTGTTATAYQWQRNSGANGAWTNISNATSKTYSLTGSDINYSIRVLVNTTNTYYNVSQGISTAYGTIAKATANTTTTISGAKSVGSTLTANVSGLPSAGTNTISYKWQESTAQNGAYSDISGATTKTYTLKTTDISKWIRCVVAVSGNAYYNVNGSTSAAYGAIGKGTATASVSISGTKTYGQTLTATPTQPAGTTATSYQWQRNNGTNGAWANITNATGKTYTLGTADVGYSLRVLMNTTNTYYNVAQAASASYGTIAKATATATANISGTKAVGSKLTVSVGGLPSVGTNTIAYKWQYSTDQKTWTDSKTTGATTNSLTTDTSWLNLYARCVITVSGNAYYNVNGATSAAYGPIGKGSHAAPTVSLSGSKVYGATLTANVSGQPTGTTATGYQWQRNSGTNSTWANISGATGKTYVLTGGDINYSVRVLVSTTNTYYNVSQGISASYGTIGKASKAVTATVSGVKNNTSKLTVSVSGLPTTGTNTIAYQWQWSKDGSTGWTNSSYSDGKSNAIQMKEADVTYYYRCVVSVSGNAYYNVNGATSAAYGPMAKSSHAAPTVSISGSKTYGSTLTANVSGQPNGTTATTYQWQRASSSSGTWANISNATAKTYVAAASDMNKYLRVLVNTTSTYYNVTQGTSSAYGTIGKANHAAPTVTISGDKQVGAVLTASVSGQPTGTTATGYQWQRAASATGSWSNISGATAKTYTTVDADKNQYMRVLVNTTNTYYIVSQGASAGYGTILMPKSFAIYCDSDKSLLFYRRTTVPTAASTFDGRTVTAVYSDIESTNSSSIPWSSHLSDIKIIDVKDNGIKPTNIASWFKNASALSKIDNMNKFDVSAVKDMSYAFSGCTTLTKINLSGWNTSSCTNMAYMFASCTNLMQVNVTSFNTAAVTDFSDMFYKCGSVTDLDISNFDTRKATSISLMMAEMLHMQRFKIGANFKVVTNNFVAAPSSANIPDADGKWYSSSGTAYSSTAIPSLKADSYYATSNRTCVQQAYAVYSDDDKSLSFYKRSDVPDIGHSFNGKTATYIYPNLEAYDESTLFQAAPWAIVQRLMQSTKVIDNGIQPRSTAWWFNNMSTMVSCDITKLDTSKCVNMCWMFRQCYSLTSLDVSKLDTHLVTDFSSMFRDAHEIDSLDVSGWDVSKGTNMGNMFYGCNRLTELKGAENWNTKSCEHFDHMFTNDTKLTLDASKWDTSSARGASKHQDFNLLAKGVKEPKWYGLFGTSSMSADDKNAIIINNNISNINNDSNNSNGTINNNQQTNVPNELDNEIVENNSTNNKDINDNDNNDNMNIIAQSDDDDI